MTQLRGAKKPRKVYMVGGKEWEVPTREGRAREGEEGKGDFHWQGLINPVESPHTPLPRASSTSLFHQPKRSVPRMEQFEASPMKVASPSVTSTAMAWSMASSHQLPR